jgi:hypothetical protein
MATLPGAITATTLAYLGVDYFALLGSSVGVGIMAAASASVLPTPRLMLQGLLQAYLGALFGTVAHSFMGESQVHAVLIVISAVGGAGARPILNTLIDFVLTRINQTAQKGEGK